MRAVWPDEDQVFSAQAYDCNEALSNRPTVSEAGSPERVPHKILKKVAMDVLMVDGSGPLSAKPPWEQWVGRCPEKDQPQAIAIMSPASTLVTDRESGHMKQIRKRMEHRGYSSGVWFLRAHEHGAALRQDRVAWYFYKSRGDKDQGPREPTPNGLPPRPVSNLLKPFGVPHAAWSRSEWKPATADENLSDILAPCILAGSIRKVPAFHTSGPLPDSLATWVKVERGVRRILPEEMAAIKGVPKEWGNTSDVPSSVLDNMTGIHLWAAVADSLAEWMRPPSDAPDSDQATCPTPGTTQKSTSGAEIPPEWTWTPPDLAEGGDWHRARVANLEAAIAGHPESKRLRLEGLEALRVHRDNYGPDGPQQLQLLWWEFPPEHWKDVRDGCDLNFLQTPPTHLEENSPMDGEQLKVAKDFLEELIALGVLQKATTPLRRTCPLFCVVKAGQPGQWRIIADCKRGGQNDFIGKDPVHLYSSDDVLPQLYKGGWSAVADASKYFYNFPTRPEDRPYLGCIHPVTGEDYWYVGCPMGSSQSPAVACRIGNGALRLLRSTCPAFMGSPHLNTWATTMAGAPYRDDWGHGRTEIGDDGLPIARIWNHVDDFFLHAPTREKLIVALNAFMNMMVALGLICQKVKTCPPAQVQKYCGFVYDTRDVPHLLIPDAKVARARACIAFLKAGTSKRWLSRLTLAVVVGILQSLVPATPQRVGHTYLRRVYDVLHSGHEDLPLGSAFYYSCVVLDAESWADLSWWEAFLELKVGCAAPQGHASSLAVTWGDGSGTGTGGTLQLMGQHDGPLPPMELWMGAWTAKVHSFSSNWKELRTLLHTLERERGERRVEGRTLFYFTDNMTTYYVVQNGGSRQSGLHVLVRQLKMLEVELGCRLEVIHVPGLLMIEQGTDGLSRGLWPTVERLRSLPQDETLRVLREAPFDASIGAWMLSQVPWRTRPQVFHVSDLDKWEPRSFFGSTTLWTPSPEIARQAIVALLSAWVESPWDTEALFLIPRVLQREWSSISRHVTTVACYSPNAYPFFAPVPTHIPLVLLHVSPYVRALPLPDRVEPPASTHGAHRHRLQAEQVRRLS